MTKERHPFEKVLGEVLDLINDLEEKGKQGQKKEVDAPLREDLQKIHAFTKKLRQMNQEEIKKMKSQPADQNPEEMGFSEKRQKRFLDSLRKLKKELAIERNKAFLRQQILEDYEKGLIPGTKPQEKKKKGDEKKKKGKKALRARSQKKFKKIGGKDDWLPL